MIPSSPPASVRLIDLIDDEIIVTFTYDVHICQAVKNIRPHGRYTENVKHGKHWSFAITALPQVLDSLIPFGFSFSESLTNHIEAIKEEERIHRITQNQTCHIYDVMGKDIDYIMAALLNEKSERIDKVLKRAKINIEKTENVYEKVYDYLMK